MSPKGAGYLVTVAKRLSHVDFFASTAFVAALLECFINEAVAIKAPVFSDFVPGTSVSSASTFAARVSIASIPISRPQYSGLLHLGTAAPRSNRGLLFKARPVRPAGRKAE